jgi:hypothetical protein
MPISAVTFAAPRVGNPAFRDGLNSCSGVRVLHVVVRHDVVPMVLSVPRVGLVVPVSKALDKLWRLAGLSPAWAYVHAGDELKLDVRHAHDGIEFDHLETYLHLLDDRESATGAFRTSGAYQDPALVNKTSGGTFLRTRGLCSTGAAGGWRRSGRPTTCRCRTSGWPCRSLTDTV